MFGKCRRGAVMKPPHSLCGVQNADIHLGNTPDLSFTKIMSIFEIILLIVISLSKLPIGYANQTSGHVCVY